MSENPFLPGGYRERLDAMPTTKEGCLEYIEEFLVYRCKAKSLLGDMDRVKVGINDYLRATDPAEKMLMDMLGLPPLTTAD